MSKTEQRVNDEEIKVDISAEDLSFMGMFCDFLQIRSTFKSYS